jgi:hypothetical protein
MAVTLASAGYRDADASTRAHELVPSGFAIWNIALVPWHRDEAWLRQGHDCAQVNAPLAGSGANDGSGLVC